MKTVIAREQSRTFTAKKNPAVQHSAGQSSTAAQMDYFVQRMMLCPCDGGCPSCAPAIQRKLKIGAPNNKYEQEADRIADQIMAMPEPGIQQVPT